MLGRLSRCILQELRAENSEGGLPDGDTLVGSFLVKLSNLKRVARSLPYDFKDEMVLVKPFFSRTGHQALPGILGADPKA